MLLEETAQTGSPVNSRSSLHTVLEAGTSKFKAWAEVGLVFSVMHRRLLIVSLGEREVGSLVSVSGGH